MPGVTAHNDLRCPRKGCDKPFVTALDREHHLLDIHDKVPEQERAARLAAAAAWDKQHPPPKKLAKGWKTSELDSTNPTREWHPDPRVRGFVNYDRVLGAGPPGGAPVGEEYLPHLCPCGESILRHKGDMWACPACGWRGRALPPGARASAVPSTEEAAPSPGKKIPAPEERAFRCPRCEIWAIGVQTIIRHAEKVHGARYSPSDIPVRRAPGEEYTPAARSLRDIATRAEERLNKDD